MQIAPCGTDGADEVDAPVAFKGLVLDGDERLSQHRWEVAVGNDDAAFERKGADLAAVDIEQFGGGVRAVTHEVVHLRQVDRVDEHEAAQRSEERRQQQQRDEGGAYGDAPRGIRRAMDQMEAAPREQPAPPAGCVARLPLLVMEESGHD